MHTYLFCEIHGGRFAFDVERVTEVVRMPWVTRVAETPPDVHGVVNYRGTNIAVVDPAMRLLGARAEPGLDSYLVVVGIDRDEVGLVVDRVQNLAEATFSPPPKDAATPSFVLGHLDDGRGLATVLDVGALLRPEVREFVSRARDSAVPPA
jgi:chemotaxis signal transduction protein